MKRTILAFVPLLLVLTAACAVPPSPDRPWAYSDLRLLDPSGAASPSADLLAVYTRTADFDVQIRIDFLDLTLIPDQDIYVALDTRPGGLNQVFLSSMPFAAAQPADLTPTAIDWNTLLVLPAAGAVRAFTVGQSTPSRSILPRVVRDPWLDSVTVSLNRYYLPERFNLQVFVTQPCDAQARPCDPHPVDQTGAFASDGQPPLNRAPLLLAFWDSYPAYSPALALRRWDGAHTGPTGTRHGLGHIVDAAGRYRLPVALLDLKNPASLAALDYMGLTPRLRQLAERRLLLLPDVAYAQPAGISLDFSRRAAAGFGMPASRFVYAASADLVPGYAAQFVPLADRTHIARSGGLRLIPLPAAGADQATDDGPSLDVRRDLVTAAFSSDPSRLVVLGGDLPHSTWGNADAAAATFAWIAAHPWVRVLDGEDLLTFPIAGTRSAVPLQPPLLPAAPIYDSHGSPTGLDAAQLQVQLLEKLRAAPKNSITDLAWQTYLTLTATDAQAGLQSLRAQYLGQVGNLLAAARWAGNPTSQAGCAQDFDSDGQDECVLSNSRFFAIFELDGARLALLFYLDKDGPHQLVAPSSQFAVGLSDPSDWHPQAGPAADPGVIPGAFTDSTAAWTDYQAGVIAGGLVLTDAQDGLIKTYRLSVNGLEVTYRSPGLLSTRIPLAVDAERFLFGPADYLSALGPHTWTWGLQNGLQVEVRSEAALAAEGFTSSFPFLSAPEDPNRDYPAGHYFPFPLSVVTLRADKDFSVQISIR